MFICSCFDCYLTWKTESDIKIIEFWYLRLQPSIFNASLSHQFNVFSHPAFITREMNMKHGLFLSLLCSGFQNWIIIDYSWLLNNFDLQNQFIRLNNSYFSHKKKIWTLFSNTETYFSVYLYIHFIFKRFYWFIGTLILR